MKSFLLALIFSFCAIVAFSQTNPTHNISIKIVLYHNSTIYLGAYYGKGQILADSAKLDVNGGGRFNGTNQLTDGLYFIASPKKKILLEFLLTDGQHFSINADVSNNNVKFIGSPDNDLFQTYIKKTTVISLQNTNLANQLKNAKNHGDSLNLQLQFNNLNTKLHQLKDSIIFSSPKSLTALLLIAGKQPELPPNTILKTKKDTIKAVAYIRMHFWQNVPFSDDRLLYTPFFEPKIDNYFNYYVSPVADSVINELQYMLLYARTGKQMYPYLLMKFSNQYFNPQHVGQNKVFLYLFNEFYMKGDTALLNPQSKKMIFDRAYKLMANQVGDPAPVLDMTGLDDKVSSLYNITAPYTMVIFWEPSCIHCQKELPGIDSIYRAKWKKFGLKIYTVNINNDLQKDVPEFIKSNKLSTDWIFTYQSAEAEKAIAAKGALNYFQLYDVYDTPSIYLLDAQKHIIAKHLNIEQFDALLSLKVNTKNSQ
jgi:thiol-disulfide isomerase/thioredoxin